MKSLLSTLLVFAFMTGKAAIITVSNNSNIPGQYTNLQTAINAANTNDTLYVIGSTTDYGSITINKKLTIIGSGMFPNNPNHLSTMLVNVNYIIPTDGSSNPSGGSITGCIMSYLSLGAFVIDNLNVAVSNLHISRNKILAILTTESAYASNNYAYAGLQIDNNVIGSIGISRLGGNSIVNNNIIAYGIQSTGFLNSGNWLLINNVIKNTIQACNNMTAMNNIIYIDETNSSNINGNQYCDFTKNLMYSYNSYQYVANFLVANNNNYNTYNGNIINQNPNFVKNSINENPYSYNISSPVAGPFIDYHLNADSPGKNYGTDGTDIGIYGGTTPFVEGTTYDSRYRYFPLPAIPQILQVTITNQSIPVNGTLNVNLNAIKQN